eukprot:scaffold118514_cov81-Phaeocystis_antarctica.AAC.1
MIHKYATALKPQAATQSVIPLGVGPPPLRQRVAVAGRRAHQIRGRVHPAQVCLHLRVPRVEQSYDLEVIDSGKSRKSPDSLSCYFRTHLLGVAPREVLSTYLPYSLTDVRTYSAVSHERSLPSGMILPG